MCGPLNTTAVNGYMRLTRCKLMHIYFFLYLKDIWIKDISEISMNIKQEVSLFVVIVVGQSLSLIYFKTFCCCWSIMTLCCIFVDGHPKKLPLMFPNSFRRCFFKQLLTDRQRKRLIRKIVCPQITVQQNIKS